MPGRPAHRAFATVRPVDLGLLAGQRRETPQLLLHEWQGWGGGGGPHGQPRGDALALQYAADRRVLAADLPGNGAEGPLIDGVQAQELLLEVVGDCGRLPATGSAGRSAGAVSSRRDPPGQGLSAQAWGWPAAAGAGGGEAAAGRAGRGLGRRFSSGGSGPHADMARLGLCPVALAGGGGGSLMRHLRRPPEALPTPRGVASRPAVDVPPVAAPAQHGLPTTGAALEGAVGLAERDVVSRMDSHATAGQPDEGRRAR